MDAVLLSTLRWLFIFYLLMYYHLYFYTRESFSESFHMYNPRETVRALLWYIQLPSWQNQPRTAKTPGLKVDDESRAQEGQVRVRETRIHTARLAPSPFKLAVKAWSRQDCALCVYLPGNLHLLNSSSSHSKQSADELLRTL